MPTEITYISQSPPAWFIAGDVRRGIYKSARENIILFVCNTNTAAAHKHCVLLSLAASSVEPTRPKLHLGGGRRRFLIPAANTGRAVSTEWAPADSSLLRQAALAAFFLNEVHNRLISKNSTPRRFSSH